MMYTTSAQTSYAGQPGYNDCLTATFTVKSITPSKLLPCPLSPPPMMSPNFSGSSDETSSNNSEITNIQTVTLEETENLLAQVFQIKSKLLEKEFNHYKLRLDKNLPTLPPTHLELVFNVLEFTLLDRTLPENQQLARQHIVDYMVNHNGISGWALPLRKIVESMCI